MPPASPAQPPPQPAAQQPQPSQQDDDNHLVAVIVAALAAYWTVDGLTRALRAPFKAAGISGAALSSMAALVLSWPQGAMEGTGPAQRWAIRTNLSRRAGFLLAAAKRTQAAIVAARSQNQPVMAAVRDALATEQRYLAAHVAASQQRITATSAVDGMAATYGNLLGWRTVKDKRTTAECYDADGCNFHADKPPLIGFPGATHPNCRCIPVKPFKGAPVLP